MMDRAVWTRVDGVQGTPLDLLAAHFFRHHYAPHAHAEFAIGVCTDGVEVIRYRASRCYTGPGSVVVLEPGEPHTGGPAASSGFAYRVLYPGRALLSEGRLGQPHFRDPVIEDPQLADELRRVHISMTRGGDRLTAETRLCLLLTTLVRRHAVAAPAARDVAAVNQVAHAAMTCLGDQLVNPPSLAEVAAGLGLSRYQVLRAFHTAVGMPPYAWLAQHRVARARALLEAGHRPAQAAVAVGFADQAHLTRWFRRVLGVTPGAFRNSVQDSLRRRP
jgi:AraC-like DNA-binding protein